MSDYSDADRGLDPETPERPSGGPRLPGGISMQTAAAALLIVAVVAVLWLLTVGPAEAPPDLATATVTGQPAAAVGGTRVGAVPGPSTSTVSAAASPASSATSPPGASGTVTATRPVAVAPGGTPGAGLAEGAFAQVVGTGPDGIRYRLGPGLDYLTIRIVMDGEVLRVAGGPETGDDIRWWRLQDDQGNVGWAAEAYLAVTTAPAQWNPPAASPTFGATSAPAAP